MVCWPAGNYRGSGLYAPDGLPETLVKEAAALRRVFFDREPVAERRSGSFFNHLPECQIPVAQAFQPDKTRGLSSWKA